MYVLLLLLLILMSDGVSSKYPVTPVPDNQGTVAPVSEAIMRSVEQAQVIPPLTDPIATYLQSRGMLPK